MTRLTAHGPLADGRERALFRRVPRSAANDPLLADWPPATQGRPAGRLIEGPAKPRRRWRPSSAFQHLPPRPAQGHQQPGDMALAVAAGSCVFLGDVSIRRVSVIFAWLPPLLAGPAICPPPPAGGGPAAVHRSAEEPQGRGDRALEQLRAATRFELPAQGPRSTSGRWTSGAAPAGRARAGTPRSRRRRKRNPTPIAPEGEEKGMGGRKK